MTEKSDRHQNWDYEAEEMSLWGIHGKPKLFDLDCATTILAVFGVCATILCLAMGWI